MKASNPADVAFILSKIADTRQGQTMIEVYELIISLSWHPPKCC